MIYFKFFLIALAGLAAGLFESVFTTFLGGWASWIRPVIPFAVFLVVLERRNAALLFCASAGLAMDAFAIGPTSLAIWRLLLAVAAMSAVADKVLTNRSVYAASALVILGRLVDFVWLIAAQEFANVRGLSADFIPTRSEALGILVWDLALTVSLFLLGMFVLRRYLRPRRMLTHYG